MAAIVRAPDGPAVLIDQRIPVISRMADAIIGLALAGSILCVTILSSQVKELRRDLFGVQQERAAAQTLELTLRRNIRLSALEGLRLPESMVSPVRAAMSSGGISAARGAVLLVYTPMSCERALHDGIGSLQGNPHIRSAGIASIVVVGGQSSLDRERALLMRADSVITMPVAFATLDRLRESLVPPDDSTFDDEPIYLRVDRDLTIRSAFHGDQFRPQLLERWLDALR